MYSGQYKPRPRLKLFSLSFYPPRIPFTIYSFLLLLLFTVPHIAAQVPTNSISQTPKPTTLVPPKIDYNNTNNNGIYEIDPTGSGILFVSGVVTSFINIFGCIVIFVLSYRTSKNLLEPLSPTQRFPLYMAVLDLLTAAFIVPNLLYPMIHNKLLPGVWCKVMGFGLSTLISMNMMLMAIIAVITYLSVCHKKSGAAGAKDWALFASTILPSLSIAVITLAMNGYGPDTFWCFTQRSGSGSQVNLVAMVAFAYIVTAITTFCYLNVIKRIHNVESLLSAGIFKKSPKSTSRRTSEIPMYNLNSPSISERYDDRRNNRSINKSASYQDLSLPTVLMASTVHRNLTKAEKRVAFKVTRATRRMSSYIFLQLIQYTPVIIYCLCLLVGANAAWVYILTITILNLGGVAKAIAYVRNEHMALKQSTVNPSKEKASPEHSRRTTFRSVSSSIYESSREYLSPMTRTFKTGSSISFTSSVGEYSDDGSNGMIPIILSPTVSEMSSSARALREGDRYSDQYSDNCSDRYSGRYSDRYSGGYFNRYSDDRSTIATTVDYPLSPVPPSPVSSCSAPLSPVSFYSVPHSPTPSSSALSSPLLEIFPRPQTAVLAHRTTATVMNVVWNRSGDGSESANAVNRPVEEGYIHADEEKVDPFLHSGWTEVEDENESITVNDEDRM
ncbi:7295_t:CDS:2 [Paraglomus occultum]|uniref:7295_t:CDS:1 n=1 Tax=Paraglomus occultum TaxID=144539 RepID=A0A9N9CCX6_9GLOM|nr:7295_t:CDS:2 [Paraglomus occultum]